MSAYIVDQDHIRYMVLAADDQRLRWYWDGHWYSLDGRYAERDHTEVGQMLWMANFRSVQERYGARADDELPGGNGANFTYVHTPPRGHIEFDPVQVIKTLKCYEYQSCEHPEWEASEAKRFCEVLRHHIIIPDTFSQLLIG